MGDTNPFHPECVKFQPLPGLLNPLWLGMQQSALSAERLHLQNWGLQAAAAYLALTSGNTESPPGSVVKGRHCWSQTQADCIGVAAAVAIHSPHHHCAVRALVGTGMPVVTVVVAGFSSGSGLLLSASLH